MSSSACRWTIHRPVHALRGLVQVERDPVVQDVEGLVALLPDRPAGAVLVGRLHRAVARCRHPAGVRRRRRRVRTSHRENTPSGKAARSSGQSYPAGSGRPPGDGFRPGYTDDWQISAGMEANPVMRKTSVRRSVTRRGAVFVKETQRRCEIVRGWVSLATDLDHGQRSAWQLGVPDFPLDPITCLTRAPRACPSSKRRRPESEVLYSPELRRGSAARAGPTEHLRAGDLPRAFTDTRPFSDGRDSACGPIAPRGEAGAPRRHATVQGGRCGLPATARYLPRSMSTPMWTARGVPSVSMGVRAETISASRRFSPARKTWSRSFTG